MWHQCRQRARVFCVCTHTHWHAPSCPLPCSHVWLFLQNLAWSWSQRTAHSLLPEASGHFHALSPGFSQKVVVLPLGDRRIILFPSKTDFVWPELLTHIANSLSLMRLYFWKIEAQDTSSFYILTAAFVNFHFLLANHIEIALGSGRASDTNCRWEYSLVGSTQALPIPAVQKGTLNEAYAKMLFLAGTLGLTDFGHFWWKLTAKLRRQEHTAPVTAEPHSLAFQCPQFSITCSSNNWFVFWNFFKPQSEI